jgi:hypothetical protein
MPNRTSWRIHRCERVRRLRAISARGCSSTGCARHSWRLDTQEVLIESVRRRRLVDAVGAVRQVVVVRVLRDLRCASAACGVPEVGLSP